MREGNHSSSLPEIKQVTKPAQRPARGLLNRDRNQSSVLLSDDSGGFENEELLRRMKSRLSEESFQEDRALKFTRSGCNRMPVGMKESPIKPDHQAQRVKERDLEYRRSLENVRLSSKGQMHDFRLAPQNVTLLVKAGKRVKALPTPGNGQKPGDDPRRYNAAMRKYRESFNILNPVPGTSAALASGFKLSSLAAAKA